MRPTPSQAIVCLPSSARSLPPANLAHCLAIRHGGCSLFGGARQRDAECAGSMQERARRRGMGDRQGSNQFPIPDSMKAWVLGDPEQLSYTEKPVPQPGPAEVLVRVDAVAICATDLEVISHGLPQ